MKTDKIKKGFTFIETILYIAISTIVIGVLFAYGWNMISAKTKSATIRETSSSARFITERIKREIRMSTDVDSTQSVFGGVGKITLTTPQGKVVIESVGDRMLITRGNSPAQFLAGNNVRIRNFELSKQESINGKVQYVGFSFTVEAYYPQAANRFEYNYSVAVNSGTEIRSQ